MTHIEKHSAIRQIQSPDGLSVLSTVKSAGGFRFIEERDVHEPAGPGYKDYWYWEIAHESGIYSSEEDAYSEAVKSIRWLG